MNFWNPNVSYFAKTNFRNDGKLFGIYQKDRMLHAYILGKTGTGKTNLLTTLILQDIINNRGCAVFDVHGDLLENLLEKIPKERLKDVVHIDVFSPTLQYRYNPLRRVSDAKKPLVVGALLDAFKKLWKSAWGLKLEHILRYIILTLISQEKADLSDIPKIIHDISFRERCISKISNKDILKFWQEEFVKYTKADLIPSLSKVVRF